MIGLDPVKAAYTPGEFRLHVPAAALDSPPLNRLLDRLYCAGTTTDWWSEAGDIHTIGFRSFPWARRRAAAEVARITAWVDVWLDRHYPGGRMAWREWFLDKVHHPEPAES